MTPAKKRYKNGFCKFLLLTVYLFFFTAQINGRFYSIANFYVYNDGGPAGVTAGPVHSSGADSKQPVVVSGSQGKLVHSGKPIPVHPGKASHLMVYKTAPQGRLHLSLDKRFFGKQSIQATAAGSLPALLVYAEVKRKYAVCHQAVLSFDRTITSLRGPPSA